MSPGRGRPTAGSTLGCASSGAVQELSFTEAWRIAVALLKRAFERRVRMASGERGLSGCAQHTHPRKRPCPEAELKAFGPCV